MIKKIIVTTFATGLLCTAELAGAEERATKTEAEAMVKKAVAAYKTGGEKALADFTVPSKKFTSKDLYIAVYNMSGQCVAHGQNAKQVGKNLIGMKDSDGKSFVKERVDLARSKGKFWQDYKFTDPLTKKVLSKQMYCEKGDNKNIICGGIYKE